MKSKIIRSIFAILFLGLFTMPGLAGTEIPSVKKKSQLGIVDPVLTEKPNPIVTVSFVIYKGPNPEVTVSTVVYKGKDTKIGKAPSMKISPKKNLMVKQVKIVLLPSQGKTFKVGVMIPLKVIVSNALETKPEPGFEFQQLNGRIWRKIFGQRVTGNITKRFKEKITLTRYAKFKKAGVYRWRCQINKGAWSAWSEAVKVTGSNTRATSTSNNPAQGVATPGRATNRTQ